jgi:hypothetical protein
VEEPSRLGAQRAKRLLRDLADQPFIALVMPDDGDTKIYVKGVSPDKMLRIQKFVERVLSEDDTRIFGIAMTDAQAGDTVEVTLR